ncbi:hypothetical protein QE152_g26359 [Popillia japonica]|uniref:Uncharacterized protein n=1 Tax=Popillia japonica TaxID=7064 RepID=A0AAW1JYM5_POPJA
MALLGNMPEFVPTGDFNIYKERLEQYFITAGISDEEKVAVLITTLHSSVYTTLRNLCYPDDPSTFIMDIDTGSAVSAINYSTYLYH